MRNMTDTMLEKLFNTQAYFGHNKKDRNPKLKPFIYKTINGLDIIDLDQTTIKIKHIQHFLEPYRQEDILIVSDRHASGVKKWKPGMLTNFQFSGLDKMPSVIIVDRVDKNKIAVNEALKCNIPVIGICDTNASIKDLKLFVVINDDSDKAIHTLFEMIV